MKIFENIVKMCVLIVLTNTTAWSQDIYVLRFSDTTTFSVTCGIVDSQWTVRNNSCFLNSTVAIVPGDSLVDPPKQLTISVKINHSGNVECDDVAIIQHSVNNASWVTDTTIQGCSSNSVTTVNKTVTLACQNAIRLRVNLITNQDNEFWQVKEAKITVNSGGGPLPIELISFSATATVNGYVELLWSTAAEINNDFYTIERSQNGLEFEIAGQVKGSGTSTKVLNYNFIDDNPLPGISYYRLKQTDFDGQYEYFKLVTINLNSQSTANLSIYPNPINIERKFTVCFTGALAKNEEITITLTNLLGKENSFNYILNQDNNFIISGYLDKNIEPGIYWVNGKGKNTIYCKPLIIQ